MNVRNSLIFEITLVLVFVLTAAARSVEPNQFEVEHALSMEFETPHTKWAKPYADGKTRVLCLAMAEYFDGGKIDSRWIIELLQRFDLDAKAVYWMPPKSALHSTRNPEFYHRVGGQRLLDLLDQRWDAFIFHRDLLLTDFTSQQQDKLLKQIKEGAGLVVVGTDNKRVLKSKNRIDPSPAFLVAGGGVGDAFRIGQGRGIRLPPPSAIGYRLGWEIEYDYWVERLGRAVHWAAGKEPKMQLTVKTDAAKITRSDLTHHRVMIGWENVPEGPVNLDIVLRGHRGIRLDLGAERIGGTDGSVERVFPPLAADQYHVDVRAFLGKKIVAWATTPFNVTPSRRVNKIELERDWGEVGEQIVGTVALAGEAVANERVQVRLVDRRGRILAQTSPRGKPLRFRFPIPAWMPMRVRVEAAVMSGKEQVAARDAYFKVTKRHRDQFNTVIWWQNPSECAPLEPYMAGALARLGITIVYPYPPGLQPASYFSDYEIACAPYSTRIQALLNKNGIMKDRDTNEPACWNDDNAINQYVGRIVNKQQTARKHGAFVYSLGDEIDTRGACIHPACLAAYRRYLEQEYGQIAALNASWGNSYANWGDVQLSEPEDHDETTALRTKNYPRWYDRKAFQCYNFVQLCKRFGEAYRQLDPRAITGFEGAGTIRGGDDYDLIVRTNGFWAPYSDAGDEIIRSIAPRGFLRSNWMGYTKEADQLIAKYWRMITRGCDHVFFWMTTNIGPWHALLAPHWGPYPATRELVDETQIVRDGLGTLLTHSQMLDDGIAILYSHPSCYANKLESSPSFGSTDNSHSAWYEPIRDLGLQFRYVTDRMMRLGEFDASKFKVLILPKTEAIGPKEAEVIEAFARNGATVIADVRPGLYDGHCNPLEVGALDKLFGIRRIGKPDAQKGPATLSFGTPPVSSTFEDIVYDTGITPAGAKPHGSAGDVPLMLVNNVGKGKAVLLNFAMTSYPSLAMNDAKLKPTPEAAADILRNLFASAGVRPAVRVETRDGARVRNLETIRWQNGNIKLIALFRNRGGDAENVNVSLSSPQHVYDLRLKKHHGNQRTFPTQVLSSRPTFLVLAPESLAPVKASLSQDQVARGSFPQLRLKIPNAAGLHALRIRADTPSASHADWLDKVLLVGKEPRTVTMPIAHNDPVGKWNIRIIDLYTEKSEQVVLTVK